MGGKKVTVGYHYELAWHDGLCLGPIDAYLGMEAGTKMAWQGRLTESANLGILEPNLWGGEKDQGGIVGPMRVMFGDADQVPNVYLTEVFGNRTVAWRGVATVCFEGGRWGANNPYQMKRAHFVERIKKGWDNDECWYPEKAAITVGDGDAVVTLIDPDVVLDSGDSSLDGSGGGFDFSVPIGATIIVELGPSSDGWSYTPSDDYQPENYHYLTWWNAFGILNLDESGAGGGTHWLDKYGTAAEARAAHEGDQVAINVPDGGDFRLYLFDADVDDNRGNASFRLSYSMPGGRFVKNPAHIILETFTQSYHAGLPIEQLNLDSFAAAADWFHSQTFGLGTARRPDRESPAEYCARIERVAGCSVTQSFDDGLYYIDIANGEYVLEDLPILSDDDVLDFEEIPTTLDNAINSVSVKYFDPWRNETITTRPLQALALIAEFGENHQTYDFPEIPTANIAGRVQMRELLATATPTRTFSLVTTPKTRSWRKGTYFRLQLPKRGIADMVCWVAEGDDGKLTSGNCQFKATQDVYSLPETVYSGIELGVDPSGPEDPLPNVEEVVFEAPYIDAVTQFTPAELEALAPDAGFAVGVAANPGGMLEFTMAVDAGAGYQDNATGDYCPTCLAAAFVPPGQKIGIAFTDGVRLAQVEIGSLVLWDSELCRVDAVDLDAGTLNLSRSCGDTVPVEHLEGSRLYFYQSGAAVDPTEYTDGETIAIKLRSNTGTRLLPLADATERSLTFARRFDRPYPPANIKINGVPLFDMEASTPGDGSGGGGGGGGTPSGPPPISAGGGPASTELGPNGGFPDDAPYWIPPVVTGEDVMDDDFSDPDVVLQHWRDRVGGPLGQGFTPEDGELRFHGITGSAYNWFRRYSFSPQPFPRYDVSVEMKVRTEFGQTARVGIAWGLNHSLDAGSETTNYIEASEAASYFEETVVSHTWRLERQFVSLSPYGYYAHVNFMPVVQFNVDPARQADAMAKDAKMSIAEVPVDMTPVDVENLDLADGLTGIDLWPDPDNLNPDSPAVTVEDGALVLTPTDALRNFRNAYWADAVPVSEVGQYVKIVALVWCNDPSVDARGITTGGAHLYLAGKTVTDGYAVNGYYIAQRGDWTERVWYWRVQGLPGGSLLGHYVTAQMKCAPGCQVKVKILSVEITDEAQD